MGSVVFDKVTKNYGDTVAVNQLSLEVREEEFFVIVGPSGAGKTTTLKLVAGLLPMTGGKMYIDGTLVNAMPAYERNTAMTFESYALYPHFTVYDNMANPLRSPKSRHNHSEERIREEINRVAGMLEISHLLDRYPKELSGGQKQRAALGRAMVRKPSVFLLDEPLSHVDAKVRHRMRVELNRLQRELNTTTIYVTHDYLEGLSLADRVGILNEGELIQVATPTQLYNKPVNEFVAKHVGQPELNLVDAEIISRNGAMELVSRENSDFRFTISREQAELVQAKANGSVHVGVRPQKIRVGAAGSGNFNGEVYVFEPFVTYGILMVQMGDQQVTVRTPSSESYEVGENVSLSIDPAELYLFDPATGVNLEHVK